MDRGKAVTRRAVTLVAAVGLVSLLLTGVARAGGGCHSQDLTDRKGNTVTLVDSCFTPTILRVGPGDTVTWTSDDPEDHTVTGANGSFGGGTSLRRGDSVAYRFDAEGVYPYFCYFHPGMVGAVVVGDGVGSVAAGSGSAVVPAGDEGEAAAGADAGPEAASAGSQEGTSRGWWTGLGLGLAAAAGVVSLVFSRRRRKRSSPTPAGA